MRSKIGLVLVGVIGLVVCLDLAWAQSVPQLINYQGRLTNPAGQPLDGVTVHLTFTFYSLQSGGTTYLSVQQSNVTMTHGIYNVQIGSGTITPGAESTLGDVFKNHAEVWLGVKVNSDVEMTPRSQFTSDAYALMSNAVAAGSIVSLSIGETCAVGEALIKTASGWGCGVSRYTNSWAWISGSNLRNQNGTYGTKAIPYKANVPGGRYGAISWTDASGKMWLFGGFGYPASGAAALLNDLWRWDGRNWTWISGSNTSNQNGTYGTKGTPASGNVPGSRSYAVSWIDAAGRMWLFGGSGYAASLTGDLNDLWRWDGTNWTWISGSNTANQQGTYGTKGTPASANVPGGRYSSVSWIDASGNLWLFGGSGYAASGSGYLNDLWRWDGSNWTWISGSTVIDQHGTYGTKGAPDSANVPGSRENAVSWIDAAGYMWLFGGDGYALSGGLGDLNDLWKWDGSNWTWISGSNGKNQFGIYGTKGTPDSANCPGSRTGAFSWIDAGGNMWLFGGYGYGYNVIYYLNDLWKWDGSNWTWISGSSGLNQFGIYGTKGTPAPANVPGSREFAVTWTDSSGNLWLFGGNGNDASGSLGYLNDLWKYYP